MFNIEFTPDARNEASQLERSEPQSFRKLSKLITELYDHPTTGTGHPEQIKGRDVPTWSRRISKKHRLVYEIHDQQVLVLIISTYGHYEDK